MTDLGAFGVGWSMARGINNLGQMVGYADTAEGLQRASPIFTAASSSCPIPHFSTG